MGMALPTKVNDVCIKEDGFYSEIVLERLREEYCIVIDRNGRDSIWDLTENTVVTQSFLLERASEYQGEKIHTKWGKKDFANNWHLLIDALPKILKQAYMPNTTNKLKQIKGNQYCLNTYQPSNISPSGTKIEARPKPWEQALKYCFVNDRDVEIVDKWLAYIVRFPDKRPAWAILNRTEQGVGKSVILESTIRPLIGESNYAKCFQEHVTGQFNAVIKDKKLIFIDEWDDARKGTANRLKTLITDEIMPINPKGLDVENIKPYSGIFVSSNEQYPMYLEPNDRRWFVSEYARHPVSQEETAKWYRDVYFPWLHSGGLQKIRDWFESMDFEEGFERNAPTTKAKEEMLHVDWRTDARIELENIISQGYYAISVKRIMEELKGALHRNEVVMKLEKAGYEETRKRFNGKQVRAFFNSNCSDTTSSFMHH